MNLVRENVQKIDTVNILYAGNKVDNLSITKIAFWNDGKETINNSDVAQNNPIRLIIDKDLYFLDAEIIYQKILLMILIYQYQMTINMLILL